MAYHGESVSARRYKKPTLKPSGILVMLWFLASITLGAQGLSPSTPAKEYIRLNGQVIAIENSIGAPGSDAPFGVIDFPYNGGPTPPLSGTLNFFGWAISNFSYIDHVDVSIDGGAVSSTAQYGASRPDVCQVYYNAFGCPAGNVGWASSYPAASLSNGSHTLTVTFVDQSTPAKQTSVSATFVIGNPAPSVVVTPSESTLTPNQTVQLAATVTGGGAVSWTINPSIGTISNNGLYTPPAVITQSDVTVTATSVADPNLSGTAIIHLNPGQPTGNMFYLSPTGDDTATGTTPQSAWKTIAHLASVSNISAGDQVLFQRGGVWREMLHVGLSGVTFGAYGTGARPIITGADLITTGWTSGGANVWSVNLTVEPTQVWFNGALGIKAETQQAVVGLNNWTYTGGKLYVYSATNPASAQIEASQRDSALQMDYESNDTFQSIAFSKGNAYTIFLGSNMSGTQKFQDVVWEGASLEGLMSLNGTLQIESSIGQNNKYGLGAYGGAGLTMTNSVLSGNFEAALMVSGTTDPSIIQNSTITGNAARHDGTYVIANWSSQPLTASHSILLPNPYLPATWSYLNLTDDSTNVSQSPAFTSRAAPLIVIPYVDDYSNLAVAQAVGNEALSHGFHITYALNTALVNSQDWTAIGALKTAGHEIAAHTRTHSDLLDFNIFTIQYTGSASSATLKIDIANRKLQTFLNGASTPDIDFNMPDFYPAAYLCNDIAATPGYTCTMPFQSWWTQNYSSQTYFNPMSLADVSGASILTPYTAQADPTRYYAYEIQGSKSDIEAHIPGYQVSTFATPYSTFNDTVTDQIRNAGFQLNRNVLNDTPQEPSSYLLQNLNLYNIAALTPANLDTTNLKRSVAALVEGLGATGGVIAFYAHGYDEFSLAQWTTFFSELQSVGATCMTASEAAAYVKSHGTMTSDGTSKFWNSAIPFSPNYALTSQSPTQGAHLQ